MDVSERIIDSCVLQQPRSFVTSVRAFPESTHYLQVHMYLCMNVSIYLSMHVREGQKGSVAGGSA